MFTTGYRRQVRTRLLERAREDGRIAGAAITGSAAHDAEDRWSDIDLFFGVAAGSSLEEVLSDWSDFAYRELGAVHHFDLRSGPAIYRAFLLGELLEIDLGFTPVAAFGPLGTGGFRLVFGEAADRRAGASDPGHLIGLAWHHVLHARTSVERGAVWQAEYWISGVRDHTLALACLRLGHPAGYAKGADRLPAEITGPVREALVRALDVGELSRALEAATRALLRELRESDAGVAAALEGPLLDLAAVPASPARNRTPSDRGVPGA
ncbi:hypothetical protein ACFFMN_26310 [Planobispora siamensis]|uniref:Nucleotidyltransferase domain-containing protein n=1 Tax=Planobispora siamensis TaxID=936338 RepID=A0A8J3SE22_9ACTN|nr:hypothetical protein [Planobispora siamensis]GIH90820.1 hypothetical protein Psi01_14500 [Planobispora siamensis]